MEATFSYHSLLSIALSISMFLPIILSLTEHDHGHGKILSLEMIHRDSLASPLHNPAETHWQRLSNALRRSNHRCMINTYTGVNASAEALLTPSQGEYLVNISIGTPPKTLIGIVDTGSDLIWTQCKPCMDCFKQQLPLFDPTSSSTYKPLSCLSKQCHFLNEGSCTSNFCYYNYSYGDMSYTTGNLSLDTVTLGSISSPSTIFGCGHHNGGIFSGIESGIVGLGSGAVSLVSQIGYLVGGKLFSYCLVPIMSDIFLSGPKNVTSKMYFGGKVSGQGVVSTPLLSKGNETYYYLELQGISVGVTNITLDEVHNNSQAFKGNIIIDSGTTITLLPLKLYDGFESAIRKAIHGLNVTQDPSGILQLCYKTKADIGDVAPNVTIHFNGADVKLKPMNTFVRVSEDVVCLVFLPTEDVPIYGNVAQIDFLVEFDLDNKTLSFKSTDCSTE